MEAYMEKAYSSKKTGDLDSGFLRLPVELQDAIIGLLPPSNLKHLQQVSRHFHDRASRHVWRKLHFKLVPGGVSNRSSQHKLAEALRTLTASDHDYAQYVHDFQVKLFDDGISPSSTNELTIAARFLPDSDAQKLLSLSLFMLLRRADSLERFRWLLPIELDSDCWKEIAKSQSLRRLAVQLNARNSTYMGRNTEPGIQSYRNVSGCAGLNFLAFTEIDDLNHLSDLAACIRSSAGSLKSLKLTFSSALAAKAKKAGPSSNLPPPPPPIDIQFDDVDDMSSQDEDFQIIHSNSAQQAQDPEIVKKHRSVQESALAQLLSVDSPEIDTVAKSVEQVLSKAAKSVAIKKPEVDPELAKSLHDLVDKVMQGKKVEDTQMLEQLREKLDSATISRSAKRQKPSASKKGKKSHKSASASTTAMHQNYGAPSYAPAKSSNTSTLSNPWAASTFPPPTSGSPYATSLHPYSPSMAHPALPSLPSWNPANQQPGASLLTSTLDPYLDQDTQHTQQGTLDEELLFEINLPSGKDIEALATEIFKTMSEDAKSVYSFSALKQMLAATKQSLSDLESLGTSSKPPKTASNTPQKWYGLGPVLTEIVKPPGPPPPASWGKSDAVVVKTASKKLNQLNAQYADDLSEASECPSDEASSSSTSSPADQSISEETKDTSYDDMGVDIVHPDHNVDESGAEQENVDDGDDTPRSLIDKGKGKAKQLDGISAHASPHRSASPGKHGGDNVDNESKDLSPEQAMREWIRSKHGLALESLELYLIPLKASVLGRALQLHILKRICLLSVGGQGPFWQLMCKAQEDVPLSLVDIYTDDVSAPFLQCVSKLRGVTKLVLRRRSKKASDNTTSKDPASIEDIRKLAVQPHINTLVQLALENNQDQSWCLTQGFIWLLCARGSQLRELAFQCGTHRMFEFTSRTDTLGGTNKARPDGKLKLPNLITLHYLGVGPTSTSPPPGAHSSSQVSGPGLNGEPVDPSHDLWARDNYKNCREMLSVWAKHRRDFGDTKLKYIGVHSNCLEIGPSRTVNKVPAWLLEDFETASENGTATKGMKFNDWLAENGYEKWISQKQIDVRPKRLQDCRAAIFSKSIRNAKL